MRHITKIVAYYRLSRPKTERARAKQSETPTALKISGEHCHILAEYNAPIIGEFTEIMTGTNSKHRQELAKAISMARLHPATLVVKQDRFCAVSASSPAFWNQGWTLFPLIAPTRPSGKHYFALSSTKRKPTVLPIARGALMQSHEEKA